MCELSGSPTQMMIGLCVCARVSACVCVCVCLTMVALVSFFLSVLDSFAMLEL